MGTTDPARLSSGPLSPEAAGARLSELFEEHGRMVYGLCRVLLRDADEAEDAAQQAFLSAHRSMLGGTEPREPAAWLGAIARNECRTRIRARMGTPLALVGETTAVAADVEHVAGRHAEIEALCVALAELPQQQREAIVLREFYGLSYEEVATALDLTEGAVESLLFRARKRLQTELRPARIASGALALPLALRDSLAAALPGFSPASSGGALAKLASLPVAAKLAATAATLTAAGTIGYVGIEWRDHEPVSSQRAPAAARSEHPRPASEPVAVHENAVAAALRTAGEEERENEAAEDEEHESETESGEQETENEVENQVGEPDGEAEDTVVDEADDGGGDGDSGQSEGEAVD